MYRGWCNAEGGKTAERLGIHLYRFVWQLPLYVLGMHRVH